MSEFNFFELIRSELFFLISISFMYRYKSQNNVKLILGKEVIVKNKAYFSFQWDQYLMTTLFF